MPVHMQRMITAHGHDIRALSQHGHRAALYMDAAGQGSMWKTSTRLNNKKVQAHAWCMFIAFGIILPIGVIWARWALCLTTLMRSSQFLHLKESSSMGLLLYLISTLAAARGTASLQLKQSL